MTLDARDSPTIQRLLERLPEFKPESDERDAFSAISELTRWALPSRDETLLRRVFAAVDEVYADQSLRDGGFLAIEFFEIVCAAGRARFDPYLGTTSREWFDRHCA